MSTLSEAERANELASRIEEQKRSWLPIAGHDCTNITFTPAERELVLSRLRADRLASLPAVGAGWKLVPVEPTEEMIEAAQRREDEEPLSSWGNCTPAPHAAIYKAMLAAAPPAPAEDGVDDSREEFREGLEEGFHEGVEHVVNLLAKLLGIENFEQADGSEDHDTDLGNTLLNILAEKKLFDKDGNTFATLAAAPAEDTALLKAFRFLVIAARTSGGVAGRDETLCAACDDAEAALAAASTPRGGK